MDWEQRTMARREQPTLDPDEIRNPETEPSPPRGIEERLDALEANVSICINYLSAIAQKLGVETAERQLAEALRNASNGGRE